METSRHLFRVDRREINYLKITIESYDGMAVVKTIDPYAALIELQISPGCEILVFELLDSLANVESIPINAENRQRRLFDCRVSSS
jgi:hypothetical protein